MSKYLDVAKEAVEVASRITMKHFDTGLRVHTKRDRTPVTEADRRAEKAIVRTIRKYFPDHSFHGEEYGSHGDSDSNSEYVWIIDPIDGTKNFIAGIPLWGTLIALRHKDEIVLGISHIPCVNELLWAEKGKGARLNGKRIHVSSKKRLSTSMISFGSLSAFTEISKKKQILKLTEACKRQRSFGDCWPYHLLAAGKLEIVVEAKIKLVDVAPFDLIIREAGGKTSDIDGHEMGKEPQSFLATNGRVHTETLHLLR